MNSTHKVEVVPLHMERHPAADRLSIVQVFGYQCVVATDSWDDRTTKAGYLPPDSLVDVTRPEFTFLAPQAKADGKARIKAKNLRGVQSFGCLFPVPEDCEIGDDVAERFGVTHYEPPTENEKRASGKNSFLGGVEDTKGPSIHVPKYDLDAFRRFHHLFVPGEPVVVTEKLDGCNAAFVFDGERMHCRSRTTWKREFADTSHLTREYLIEKGIPEERVDTILEKNTGKPARKNSWWQALERTPTLEAYCRKNPGVVVFGEIFGNVNCIKYGLQQDQFAAFDLMVDGRYLPALDARGQLVQAGVPCVPIFERHGFAMPSDNFSWTIDYHFDEICAMADGETCVPGAKPGTIREGIVVEPVIPRWDVKVGRLKLKCVSATYLEKYH
jgi:RNA ligase (TIGR02306 family)